MKGTPFKLKQKLSPEASAAKAVRDLAAANKRAPMRNESQKARRAAIKAGKDINGMDHDHYTNTFVSSSKNRAGMNPNKKGTKNE
tara:strand:+ start:76 stop:330 length:255 start_codon:yes stop_codon:yes gene_type:complete